MRQVLILRTESNGDDPALACQRSIYRMELPITNGVKDLTFADDSHLTKGQCRELLMQEFNKGPNCMIAVARFPYFDVLEGSKYRPVVAHCGDDVRAMLLSIYLFGSATFYCSSLGEDLHRL